MGFISDLLGKQEEDPNPSQPVTIEVSESTFDLGDEQKKIFELLEGCKQNLFITGRAGTGKSVLLEYFAEHSSKNVAVVAPTGVAALNVNGQTIHSFFKFAP